jgi:hypothetical protein
MNETYRVIVGDGTLCVDGIGSMGFFLVALCPTWRRLALKCGLAVETSRFNGPPRGFLKRPNRRGVT